MYGAITNDVSDYINLSVRIAHIICNHPYIYHKYTYIFRAKMEAAKSSKTLVSHNIMPCHNLKDLDF
jgi:hypothetical protein